MEGIEVGSKPTRVTYQYNLPVQLWIPGEVQMHFHWNEAFLTAFSRLWILIFEYKMIGKRSFLG